jgi:TetR/AcrR family transcriptional regulator, regulator of cefoperazone and chloramphenicol sensitivity
MPGSAIVRSLPPKADAADPTRLKLLEAAGQVFSEQGFHAATIREICARAEANVAAVNYHFRDKLGLYAEVLRGSIASVHANAPKEYPAEPEEALRAFIAAFLKRMVSSAESARNLRMMVHELAHPSPALPDVVDQVMRPNYDRLRKMISRIIGLNPDHETTRFCAHSIIAQIVHYTHARPVISILWPDLEMTPKRLDQIAAHIADFSLCWLRTFAKKNERSKPGKEKKRK